MISNISPVVPNKSFCLPNFKTGIISMALTIFIRLSSYIQRHSLEYESVIIKGMRLPRGAVHWQIRLNRQVSMDTMNSFGY